MLSPVRLTSDNPTTGIEQQKIWSFILAHPQVRMYVVLAVLFVNCRLEVIH